MNTSKTIGAGEFKSKCLALLDEVARTGRGLVVTKRGKPVARVLPPGPEIDPFKKLRGTLTHQGDLVAPTGEKWDAES